MKQTLLQIVQGILSDTDGEEVNSIGDSVESLQVVSVVHSVFDNLVVSKLIPEHKQLLKLTALSDNTTPTHFQYPTNVKVVELIEYDTSDDNTFEYKEIQYLEPLVFLDKYNSVASDYDNVKDISGLTNLRIRNDKMPEYYTSFDDLHIVMDSYDSTIDTTLQESKTRAYGTMLPTFTEDDSYVPDIDASMFPYLISEAKSTYQSLFKSGSDPKTEQAARRLKVSLQNDRYRTRKDNSWVAYGKR